MNRVFLIFCLSFILFNCACGRKTKLSQDELKWINVYKQGDTLIFQSQNGDLDTMVIIKKEVYYPEYMPVEVHDKYLPQWAVVWYYNRNAGDSIRLVTMFKKDPQKETFLNINFLSANIFILNLTTGAVEKFRNGKVYEFDTPDEANKTSRPRKIFWHVDYGIIRYITHDNLQWHRINLPNLGLEQ